MSREINSLIASIRNRAEENDGGRPKHNRMAFNCEHFVCLELLILLMMESVRDVIPTPDLRIGTGSPDRPDPRRALIGGACR
jgi:hypothetical protein